MSGAANERGPELATPHRPSGAACGRAGVLLALVSALATAAVSASEAEPFVTYLEWTHPNPQSVERYRVLFAFTPEQQLTPTPVDVGRPEIAEHYGWAITIDPHSSVWVAVVAVGKNGVESQPSAWRQIDWRPGQGPLSPPGRPYLVDRPEP